MRLNQAIRQRFLRAVMDSVPEKDYDAEIRAIVEGSIKTTCPPAVRQVLETFPEALSNSLVRGNGAIVGYITAGQFFEPTPAVVALVSRLREERADQFRARGLLSARVEEAARRCHTLAALKEALPSLVSYMPEEAPADQPAKVPPSGEQPPAPSVEALLRRAGWKKPEATP